MNGKPFAYDDAYPLEEDSDQDNSDSSDDDLDVILHGTLHQRKRLNEKRSGGKSSSEDEFEKEMKAELDVTMKAIEANHTAASCTSTNRSEAMQVSQKPQSQYYDNDYFDSDSDEENSSVAKKSLQRPIPTNDDLLYDPKMDDKDQKWVDKLRSRYQPTAVSSKRLPTSDAILNCPCCMISLCMDCQRHSTYQHQYRAMFVLNCVVRTDQVLRFPVLAEPKSKKKKQQKRDRNADMSQLTTTTTETPDSVESDETFHPVMCTECNTEVGVYDSDEVYHFFNVLASHS